MRFSPVTGAALALALAGTMAAPAAEWDGDAWDLDRNAELDREEFGAGVAESGAYELMDARADGVLDEDEFYGGVFDAWDANDDRNVDAGEFDGTSAAWFDEVEEESDFDAWDANADGVIGEDEFGEVAGGSGLYDRWGGDDGIDAEEFGAGLYGAADRDGDNVIRAGEDDWRDWF